MKPGDHSISLTLIRWSIFAFLVLHGIAALVGIWAYYAISSVPYPLPGPDYEIQDLEMKIYRHVHIDSADLVREDRPYISGDIDTTIVEHIVRPNNIQTNIGFSFTGISNYLGWRLKSTINSDMGQFFVLEDKKTGNSSRFTSRFYTLPSTPVNSNPAIPVLFEFLLIYLVLAYSFSIFFLIYRFFGEINNGTPFTHKNSRRLHFIGILVSLGPLLMITAYHFFTRWYLNRFEITLLELQPDYRFNWWLFFLGLLILVIAKAFRTGIELQEDQNLTI